MNEKKDLLRDLREGKVLTTSNQIELVAKLSMPAILAQLTSVVMQYIDASMVGHMGTNQAAAIGLVSTTMWLFGSVCGAAPIGFTVQVAQLIGAKKNQEARAVQKLAFIVVAIFCLLMSVIGIAIHKQLPIWLGGDPVVWKDASDYFLIYASAMIFHATNSLAGGLLQSSGNMKVPGILNVSMCILDVVFNFLYIFPSRRIVIGESDEIEFFIPGANLGVQGAALGTVTAEVVILVFMLYFLLVKSEMLHIRLGKEKEQLQMQMEHFIKAVKIAVPVAFEQIVVCGAMIVITRIVAPLGTVSVAANSFAITAESLCYMPGYGIGSAASTLVGQSVGAGRKDLARRLGWISIFSGMGIMTITGGMMFFASPIMMSMLSKDVAVITLGVAILKIEAFAEPFYAASIVCSGALRGEGDTLIPSLMNFVSLWAVRIPISIYGAARWGLKGVWIAMCLELCFRGLIFLAYRYIKCYTVKVEI